MLLRQAAAAGLGVGIPADAGAPSPRRLVDSAATLHQPAGNDTWELHYSDSVVPYVDAAGVVDRIRLWAGTALVAAVDKRRAQAPSLLLVSGLVKTGKSYTLEHVVPAVLAEALRKQGGEGPLAGMVVLRLSGDDLNQQEGATVMLRSLLRVLLRWAHAEHVPVREGALEAAEEALARPFNTKEPDMPGLAILSFLKGVEVPVLVLCDEVQHMFRPTIGGELDARGAEYVRDIFMKRLLVHGPHTMLWCFTSSSMAHTWVNLANMPPNGFPVIASASAATLPAAYSTEHMSLAWGLLQGRFRHVPLDPKLLELCPPSIALLTVLVSSWIDAGHPSDAAAFVRGFMRTKLMHESLKEWKLGLEGVPPTQRTTVLGLSCAGVGTRTDTGLHRGLRRFLEPYLDKTVDGRHYFRDSHQRQIVRMLFNKDGTLRESWSDSEFGATLTQLDAGWNLLYLGAAADYLLGPHACRRWEREEPPAGLDEFKARVQASANEIANKLASDQGGAALGPQELWERQPWFQQVLLSKWNDRDCDTYKDNKQARCTHLAMLVLYLRLSRNVLAHTEPWDREYGVTVDAGAVEALSQHTVDLSLVEALPRVLGQSLVAFNDAMVGALRVLPRHTVEEAAAEFAAQLSGGGDGSVEGLAEGVGSSSGGLSSGTGSGGRRGSSSGGPRRRGVRAMAAECAPARPGPAVGCGQRTPLVYATGRHGGWGQGGPRAATLALRLRVQRSLFAPSAAVGLLRLP